MTFELIEPESFDFNFFITLQWPYKRKVKEIITNVNVEYCSSKTTFTRLAFLGEANKKDVWSQNPEFEGWQ